MDLYQCAVTAICIATYLMFWKRPAEQPFRLLGAHVDAAMAHRHAEVFVPVGPMECMPLRREKTGPGNAGKLVIVSICKKVPVAHVLRRILFQDTEFTLWCLCREPVLAARTVRDSGGDGRFEHLLVVLERGQYLRGQVDLDELFLKGKIGGNRFQFLEWDGTHMQRVHMIETRQIIIHAVPWLSGWSR